MAFDGVGHGAVDWGPILALWADLPTNSPHIQTP